MTTPNQPDTNWRRVALQHCKGNWEGDAFYLEREGGDGSGWGCRIAGTKCRGIIECVASYPLSEQQLEDAIDEFTAALEWLREGDSNG